MWLVKTLKHFLLVSLLPFTVHLQGKKTDDCNVEVKYPKATFSYFIGDTMVLNCTVEFCQSEPPDTYWCKHANSCEPLQDTNRTNNKHLDKIMFLVYTISHVNLTDSGKYQCVAKQNGKILKGHIITVNVAGVKATSYETNTGVTPTNSTMLIVNPASTPLWIVYSIIAVGVVGAISFLIMVTYFCIRNFHEPLEAVEPGIGGQRSQCHNMTEINGKPTIYENMNEFSEGISSSSSNFLTVNKCNSPGSQKKNVKSSDTNQHDTIIYASLNESTLNRKPSLKFVNNEDTEYAAINIKH
ncbi:uncharacterized protein LOC127576045 [Pristis pectinata]|uniref:uncharacterized protein LOC127576045 n=1 Tax=Pristis pectinata TaxID=685728 RepID=UPI00223D02DA|nr:uncharacterized protein LOC127576045 [Pristis pectinata]